METAGTHGGVGVTSAAPALAWKVHLLAERPARGALVLALAALIITGLHLVGDSQFIPLAVLVFFLSLAPFYFPTWYELTPRGVTRRIGFVRTTRRWDEFPRFYHDAEGVKLSTFDRPSRLEPFRGISLRFAGGNGTQVVDYISRYIKAPDA